MTLQRNSVLIFLLIGVAYLIISAVVDANEMYQLLTMPEIIEKSEALRLNSLFTQLIIKLALGGIAWISATVLILMNHRRIRTGHLLDHNPNDKEPVPENARVAHEDSYGGRSSLEHELGPMQAEPILNIDNWEKTYSNGSLEGEMPHDAEFILSSLAKLFRASQGVLYFKSSGNLLNPVSSFACVQKEEETLGGVSFGEGLVGEVAQINKYIYLEDIPEATNEIVSGLGGAHPKSLLLFPLTFNGKVNGVVELASFHTFKDNDFGCINRISAFLGNKVNGLLKSRSN